MNFNSYLLTEKTPREMESKKTSVYFLQKVVAEPAMTQADLTALESEVRDQGHPSFVLCSMVWAACTLQCSYPCFISWRKCFIPKATSLLCKTKAVSSTKCKLSDKVFLITHKRHTNKPSPSQTPNPNISLGAIEEIVLIQHLRVDFSFSSDFAVWNSPLPSRHIQSLWREHSLRDLSSQDDALIHVQWLRIQCLEEPCIAWFSF